MTNLEWEILDQTYLMVDYKNIVDAVQQPIAQIDNALVELLRSGLLRQLFYSERFHDFVDSDPFDETRLTEAHYVITKQGLFQHTGSA
jgi:hypothetical protein